MARSLFVSLSLPLVLVACGGETPPPEPPPPPPPAATAAAPAPAPTASAAPAPAEPAPPPAPTPVAKYAGFQAPESVLYDDQGDRYLVSNINGKPFDVDNNGFISALSPDGQVTTLKWIEGGKNKVKLDAPKGLAIAKGVLYVADITTVRMFDAKSGAPKGEVKIAGSTFLNDLAAGPDGKVYVSDSGFKAGANGFEPTGTDAVFEIDKGKAKAIAKTPDLGKPNGLLVTDKGVVVVTFGSGEVYRLDAKGAKVDASKPPKGALDGVVSLGDSLLVSSWEGSAIYRGKLGGAFDVALTDQKSPADIGYDTKRGRVLVPHFTEDTVEAYELK
ncbi:MAG: SMP-30/gluconolactonase/LRE family protein [Polyangiaceae bacterium]